MIRIANGQGFWGDSIDAPLQQVRRGAIDYLTLDYLAEVTMSILHKQRSRDPESGYARDFVEMIDRVLPEIVEKRIRVVANAGGLNPLACRRAVLAVATKHGLDVHVAGITGDDISSRLDELMARGIEFRNMDTGAPLSTYAAESAAPTRIWVRSRLPRRWAGRSDCHHRPVFGCGARVGSDDPRIRLGPGGLE